MILEVYYQLQLLWNSFLPSQQLFLCVILLAPMETVVVLICSKVIKVRFSKIQQLHVCDQVHHIKKIQCFVNLSALSYKHVILCGAWNICWVSVICLSPLGILVKFGQCLQDKSFRFVLNLCQYRSYFNVCHCLQTSQNFLIF